MHTYREINSNDNEIQTSERKKSLSLNSFWQMIFQEKDSCKSVWIQIFCFANDFVWFLGGISGFQSPKLTSLIDYWIWCCFALIAYFGVCYLGDLICILHSLRRHFWVLITKKLVYHIIGFGADLPWLDHLFRRYSPA